MVKDVPEKFSFPEEEEKILQRWKETSAFKTSMKLSQGRPKYPFYDGPPFATGLPHYGHILAGTIKDIVTRYAYQSGFHVERRFGWDCHGLPVEFEIDKTLGIKGPDDVEKMGVKAYNDECRKIVMRYASQWEEVVNRMGRWIDFENDYKTMYPWFMETVWWIFKQLYHKGFVYKGVKVMPYSVGCTTPLSNFESGQNYKDVVDPAVIIGFPLDETPDISMLAWTTTPWTLPSNLSICVNPGLQYVLVEDVVKGKKYIMMECRLEILFKKPEEYNILKRFLGKELEGKTYQPLFPYFSHLKEQGAFRVLCDNYVSEEGGTGIVHQAPYFGEDDYRVALANGLITKEQAMICPIDATGRFVEPVTDFLGLYVKDADKLIIKHLKEKGRLVDHSTIKHSYPFCWRSESPLIYRAIPSWYIRVEHMREDLLNAVQDTRWVPDFVKEKRFGNWLKDARDWAVSRNRYWGTPIPLWISEDEKEVVVVGSIAELEELTGVKITDLHKHFVDDLTIPSKREGMPPLRRIPQVFDCWFESGSMPYAQAHYPFEHKKEFETSFPADFIAEGVDQTRGWFYTLLVIGVALFNKAPFKNVIVNGLVLASDGQKMSKSKKNYPDPREVVKKYGADALRLYLINSPVVRAENLRFKEEGVRDILKDVSLPMFNAYRFFVQSHKIYEKEFNVELKFGELEPKSDNVMDQWILSFTQSLLEFVKQEMDNYRLYTVVPRLIKFVDHLTNWYVRMNRKRLKGENGQEDCQNALESMFNVLFIMLRMLAPFTPFLTENIYQNLRTLLKSRPLIADDSSIHFLLFPEVKKELQKPDVERKFSRLQTVIEAGRLIRDRKNLPLKYPLREAVIIHQTQEYLDDIKSLETYVCEELNIRNLTFTTDKSNYGVQLKADPDVKVLGLKLKEKSKIISKAIRELNDAQIQMLLSKKELEVEGYLLLDSEVRIKYEFPGNGSKYEAHADGDVLLLLDVEPDQAMLDEGIAREVINRIQKLRKKAHLVPTDPISVYWSATGDSLPNIIASHKEFIENTLKYELKALPHDPSARVIITEVTQVKGNDLTIVLIEKALETSGSQTFSKFVNIELCNTTPSCGATNNRGTVLLENPIGDFLLTPQSLKTQVKALFGLHGSQIKLYLSKDKTKELDEVQDSPANLGYLHGSTLFAYLC